MSDYILVTNFWNKKSKFCGLRAVIENVAMQTKQPNEWFFIDDGSPQGFRAEAQDEIVRAGIEFGIKVTYLYVEPEKWFSDKHSIGNAWNKVLRDLRMVKADYLAVLDVDTKLQPNYFESLILHLDIHQELGAIAGTVRGEKPRHRNMPMGGGKVVRWEIFESIEKFWRLAPDTFLNIKSFALGYKNDVLGIAIDAEPTSKRTGFDLGYRLRYTGNSVITALFKTIRHRNFDIIKGFHLSRLAEQCDDPDVRYYYSKRRILKSLFKRKEFSP